VRKGHGEICCKTPPFVFWTTAIRGSKPYGGHWPLPILFWSHPSPISLLSPLSNADPQEGNDNPASATNRHSIFSGPVRLLSSIGNYSPPLRSRARVTETSRQDGREGKRCGKKPSSWCPHSVSFGSLSNHGGGRGTGEYLAQRSS
jgi:hypothetical protein